MDEKPDQIINHIEAQRDELGRNLNELESRVRRSTDWRTYYERNPMMILGAALGGGVLLGATLGSGSDRSSGRYYRSSSPKTSGKTSGSYTGSTTHIGGTYGSASYGSPGSQPQTPSSAWSPTSASTGSSGQQNFMGAGTKTSSWADSPHLKQIGETLEQVKGALITFGIMKAKEFLAQAVPGLEQHLGDIMPGGHQHHADEASQQNQTARPEQQRQENRAQSFAGSPSSAQGSGQSESGATGSGTGTGANDYRSGTRGFSNPGPTGAGDQYAGAGSGRNPNVTP